MSVLIYLCPQHRPKYARLSERAVLSQSPKTLILGHPEDNSFENVFDDGNAMETEYRLGHEGPSINFDDVAVTAIAKRVLAEASQRPQWAQTNVDTSRCNHRSLFSDDDGTDQESPSASLASNNKENVPPAVLAPSPSPPSPPLPPPSTPDVDNPTSTQWPSYTQLIYHQTNSGLDLGLSRQHYEVKLVVRRAINIITERVIFEDAFPSPANREVWIHCALVDAIKYVGEMSQGIARNRYQRLHARVIEESQYVSELSTMIKPRVPLLRNQIKSSAVNNAAKCYDLQNVGTDKIAGLLKDLKYIYPLSQNGTVQGYKPYENEAIVSTVREFVSHHSAIETSLHALKMLKPSVIALAATAVAAAIDEWRTGHRIVAPFTANIYDDIYNNHTALLAKIQAINEHGYSSLLRRLYYAALISRNSMSISPNTDSTLLDVANMPVDVED
ncbi:hypothetical protein M378DRAFT_182008 [Amanita muscaria Koide BX008]|uniref:DUF6532 domain-containing protein n=1 Tax=Amanita muscaria (strain Koide BX008) TaxID=946122 RepID=A0A0C2WJF9_AMAMK|nr:hypothetical protein M378DRAFT_182008 [Amanita muscaria Koide BX008]